MFGAELRSQKSTKRGGGRELAGRGRQGQPHPTAPGRSDPALRRLSRAAGAGAETPTLLLLCSKKNTGTLLGTGSAPLLSDGNKELEEVNVKKAGESWKDSGMARSGG